MKCSINMYLVLDDEEDKQGFCLKECRGRLIGLDVCVKENKINKEAEVKADIESSSSTNNVLIK
jgi:hypothetical protein